MKQDGKARHGKASDSAAAKKRHVRSSERSAVQCIRFQRPPNPNPLKPAPSLVHHYTIQPVSIPSATSTHTLTPFILPSNSSYSTMLHPIQSNTTAHTIHGCIYIHSSIPHPSLIYSLIQHTSTHPAKSKSTDDFQNEEANKRKQ